MCLHYANVSKECIRAYIKLTGNTKHLEKLIQNKFSDIKLSPGRMNTKTFCAYLSFTIKYN